MGKRLAISSRVKALWKILFLNLAIFSVLMTLCVIGIPAALDVRVFIRNQEDAVATIPRHDRRYLLPVYANDKWAAKHFVEYSRLRFHFRSYVVQETTLFLGETININEDGVRLNDQPPGSPRQARGWLFGGSAMWGLGSSDRMTIPSYLEQAAGWKTANFGGLGYTARQGLNRLMKEYVEGGRPEYVIFYDGYNEVHVQCRSDLKVFSTADESNIRSILTQYDREIPRTLWVITPFLNFLRNFSTVSGVQQFDCDKDEQKATMIAKALVQDWLTAKFIVETNGGKFLPVLQPSVFVGTPNTTYLETVRTNEYQRAQHTAVYPKIRSELTKAGLAYLDLTGIFDGNEMLYIDLVHVIPRGNEMVAAKIKEAIR